MSILGILVIILLLTAALFVVLLVVGIVALAKGNGGAKGAALATLALLAIPTFLLLLAGAWIFSVRTMESRTEIAIPAQTVTPAPPLVPAPPKTPEPRRAPEPRSAPVTVETQGPRSPVVVDQASTGSKATLVIGPERAAKPTVVPAIWQLPNDDLFTARIYPSLIATAKPLAKKFSHQLRTAQSNDGELVLPTTIRITGIELVEQHRSGLLERFSQQLWNELPESEVMVVIGPASDDEKLEFENGVVGIELQIKDERYERAAWDNNVRQERGILVCHAKTARGDIRAECEYIEKPWLEDFDAFVSQRPLKRYVVGYSRSLASSEDEARRMAMEDAVERSRTRIGPGAFVSVSEQFVVDRFAQRLARPYGEVWREAVLLDVSPDQIDPVISAAHTQIAVNRAKEQSVLFGLIVLLGFTSLLCVVLNAITQGYYRNRLAVGIGAVVILAVVGVWLLAAVRESVSKPIVVSVTQTSMNVI